MERRGTCTDACARTALFGVLPPPVTCPDWALRSRVPHGHLSFALLSFSSIGQRLARVMQLHLPFWYGHSCRLSVSEPRAVLLGQTLLKAVTEALINTAKVRSTNLSPYRILVRSTLCLQALRFETL